MSGGSKRVISSSDAEILDLARRENRIVVTQDLDFSFFNSPFLPEPSHDGISCLNLVVIDSWPIRILLGSPSFVTTQRCTHLFTGSPAQAQLIFGNGEKGWRKNSFHIFSATSTWIGQEREGDPQKFDIAA